MSRSRHGKRYYDSLGENHQLYWAWCSKEPKWWRKLNKHKRRRAEWSQCRARINNGADLDDMVYPKDKQPWLYYW